MLPYARLADRGVTATSAPAAGTALGAVRQPLASKLPANAAPIQNVIRCFMQYDKTPRARPGQRAARAVNRPDPTPKLLLPGALLVTMQTQLLAPFVLVDFRLAAF